MTDLQERPLVTFALFAYNQEQYIRQAVEAALAQTYEPLEIILSDDCSSDATFHVISDLAAAYTGPHSVVARRNATNLGLADHLSTVMEAVNGALIVVAAGDDVSYPNRTARVVEQWLENDRQSGSIFSMIHTINPDGRISSYEKHAETLKYTLSDRDAGIVRTLCTGTLGCAHAWTKDVFQVFGSLDRHLIHEDITIPLRSIMLGSVTFIQEELVLYRLNDDSLSKIAYRDSRERMRKMKKYWAGRIANFEQFDLDFRTAQARRILQTDDANWLRSVVNGERQSALLNHAVFSGGFADRIRAIVRSSADVPMARKLKLVLIALFPWLYNFKVPGLHGGQALPEDATQQQQKNGGAT